MNYLNGKWCETPLQELLPCGLTKQVSFKTWVKPRKFFRPFTLKYKVIYVKKNTSNKFEQGTMSKQILEKEVTSF